MRSIELEGIAPLIDGHVDIRRRPTALQPLRYPAPEAGFYDPFTRWVATCTTGVRLRFSSNTRTLRLSGTQRMLARPVSDERRGLYDLFVDDELHARSAALGGATLDPETFATIGDEAFTLTFENLPPGEKVLELWLPQAGGVAISNLEVEDGATLNPATDVLPRILFHGSSITHCMEAEGASAGWPAVAARLAGVNHQNLGWGGSCLLSGLAARIVRDARADAIVLKLGINVWSEGMLKARTFQDSAHAMISIIREKHATTPMAIISPIYSPGREAAGEGVTLQQMRAILEEVVAARKAAGDENIRYLSGLELFGEADAGLLPDDLHPNTEGYRLMGERFHRLMLSGAAPLLRP